MLKSAGNGSDVQRCVCVFPYILVTVPRIKARRVLHFAVYSRDYTLQRILLSF